MLEYLIHLQEKIHYSHFNILMLMGVALFSGLIGAKIFQKLKFPQVVGYIIIGIFLGKSGLGVIDDVAINSLKAFNYFALGVVSWLPAVVATFLYLLAFVFGEPPKVIKGIFGYFT